MFPACLSAIFSLNNIAFRRRKNIKKWRNVSCKGSTESFKNSFTWLPGTPYWIFFFSNVGEINLHTLAYAHVTVVLRDRQCLVRHENKDLNQKDNFSRMKEFEKVCKQIYWWSRLVPITRVRRSCFKSLEYIRRFPTNSINDYLWKNLQTPCRGLLKKKLTREKGLFKVNPRIWQN